MSPNAPGTLPPPPPPPGRGSRDGLPRPPSAGRPLAPPPPAHGWPTGPAAGFAPPPHLGFRSVRGLGITLRVLFGSWMVFAAFGVWAQFQERQAIHDRIDAGIAFDPFDPVVVDERAALVALLMLVATAVTGIVFLVWFHRLYTNIPAVSVDPRPTEFSSGWSIGWWLLPFASWVFPKKMVDEVHRRSAPPGARPGRPPALYMVWWIFWIISNSGAVRFFITVETNEDLLTVNSWNTIGIGCQLVAAIFAGVVVEDLTARQHARIEEREAAMTAQVMAPRP